jgi:hypothetical protein
MKIFLGFAGAVLIAGGLSLVPARAASLDEQVAQATTPLPDDLRAGATVVFYDRTSGERKILRQGTNSIDCEPENPKDGFTRCYNNVNRPRREMETKLASQGKSDKDIQDAVGAAIKSGALKPPPMGSMSYRLTSKDGVIKRLWIVSVPYATPEMLGVSTVSQRDGALKGQGLPWMMLPGTAGAHIMIPIN